MSNYLPSTNASKAAIAELEKHASFEDIEAVRRRFLEDLRLTPQDVATELEAPLGVVMEVIVCMDWMRDRKKFHEVATESELMQYQEMIRSQRMPAVEAQLQLLGRLMKTINNLFDSSERAQERIAQAIEEGASADKLDALYAMLPSAKAANDLANACEKASGIAGRLLNIRENLFEDKTGEGLGSNNNFFVIPGATPIQNQSRPPIDVTPR